MKKADKIYQIFRTSLFKIGFLFTLTFLFSCEDFVEIDPPYNQLSGEAIFEDPATVEAALVHIYSQLRDNVLTVGNSSGLGFLLGNYTDELTYYGNTASDFQQFYSNGLVASNGLVLSLWNGSYNLIYAANNIIEGVQGSVSLTEAEKNQFLGEAYFIRAFVHFYLVNLYGDIPFIDSTDYRVNSEVSRLNEEMVYQKIIDDVLLSKSLLSTDYVGTNKVRPNKWVATALLARVYLYTENWDEALNEASEVMAQGGYTLNTDITQVFLKNSTETLWQFDTGLSGLNTLDAQTYVLVSGPPPIVALASYFIDSLEGGDARFTNWIGSVTDGVDTWYFPFKYKLNTLTGTTEECSIMIRFAEMYLISAEANARLGNFVTALNQLNIIRDRANLPPVNTTDETVLLNTILQERRVEFFTELGHRFFDLKRTGTTNSELSSVKPNWQTTDIQLPLPESELILNPNLEPQNEGY